MWTDGMAYVRTCASGTAEWRGMNRRKGVESKEGMEEMPLLYALYSVEFQRNVAFLFARTVQQSNLLSKLTNVLLCNSQKQVLNFLCDHVVMW